MLPKVTFSAWKWLAQEPVKDEATFQSEQEDALYVLGVAGLASKRLLQKHQTLTESSKPKRMTTKSADVRPKMPVMDVPIVVQAGKPLAIVNEFSQALARISDSRKSLHKFQNEKLKAAVAFCMRGPVKLCRSVWQWGGGKPTVTLTLSFTMALTFILVRLLSHVVASEGLNMTRA